MCLSHLSLPPSLPPSLPSIPAPLSPSPSAAVGEERRSGGRRQGRGVAAGRDRVDAPRHGAVPCHGDVPPKLPPGHRPRSRPRPGPRPRLHLRPEPPNDVNGRPGTDRLEVNSQQSASSPANARPAVFQYSNSTGAGAVWCTVGQPPMTFYAAQRKRRDIMSVFRISLRCYFCVRQCRPLCRPSVK